MGQWSESIRGTLKGAASMYDGVDNYYTGQWVPGIVADILGPKPETCNPNLGPGYGFEGFARRINNIATSMTNG
jgi:hypothetical protein